MIQTKGWEIKKLGEVCELSAGGDVPKDNFSEIQTEKHQIPIYANGEKNDGLYGYTSIAKVTKPSITVSARGTIGFSVKRLESFVPVVRLIVVTPKNLQNLDLSYLDYSLKTIHFKHSGSSIPQLTVPMIRDYEIPLPPLPEQKRIVSILDKAFSAIERSRNNAEQNLKNAKELFDSYLQGIFEKKGEGWEHVSLTEICKINDGTHFSPKNSTVGEFMYITAKNIKPYYIDLTTISYISAKDHKEIYARCSPMKGDVLYIKDGATAGIAAINNLDKEFSLLSSVALLKCSSKILNTFLVHYMNSAVGRKNFLGYIGGAAITRLTLIKIKNVCLSLPPLAEQQTIVARLDALSAETKRLEAIYQKKIVNLEELKKSMLQKAFNGELTTIP